MNRVLAAICALGWILCGEAPGQEKVPSPAYQEKYQQAAQAFANGNLDEALKRLDEADQIEPNVAHGFNLRGAILTRKQDFDQAEAMFRKTLEIDPGMNLALFNLGEVAFLRKDYAEARKRFQRFLEKNGSNDLGEFKVFLCDLMGGNPEAAKKAARAFPLSPSTPLRYYALAAVAFKEGNEDEAV
ncbi:MAG: tetratricopeptide repeat protein, partial [Verrucomicrobiia bacterium]